MNSKILTQFAVVASALTMLGCASQYAKAASVGKPIVLVTGITGNQGGGVATVLLEKGYRVRGLTRDTNSARAKIWRDQGVELVQGDFTDYPSVDAAVRGADYLFVNIQEQVPDYIKVSKYLFDAAHKAGVKHIVYSSNRRSEPELGVGASKTELELYLRASGYPYSIQRLPQMMSNFTRERDMQAVLRNGVQDRGPAGATSAYFAPEDMGLLAAAAFANTAAWNGREVNLAGDELSGTELAALLSELSGLDIKYSVSATAGPPVGPPGGAAGGGVRGGGPGAAPAQNVNLTYDTKKLRQEFPGIMTLRQYLERHDYGAKLKAMSLLPLPAAPAQNGPPGGPPGR